MTAIPVSVVVVSQGRPGALKRCLTGISQLAYDPFEVIVVSDTEGLEAVATLPFADQIKTCPYHDANISAARNRGIAQAAGEIVAFIDDDAVPETGWLRHLIAPFADEEVAAAGGFVRGRNGISMQWAAHSVDRTGDVAPIKIENRRPVVLHPAEGRAIKTEGTNMAVRRDILAEMGGFDPAFRYYLDETDLNLRLADRGLATAIVPLAEVHHGYLENKQRTQSRVPRDLFQIGASLAVFLRKHCNEADIPAVWKRFRLAQRRRMLGHMVKGDAMPGDVGRLVRGLCKGYAEGQTRSFGALLPIVRSADGFKPMPHVKGESKVLAGRRWQRRAKRKAAVALARKGDLPSVFLFSPTAYFHHVRFDESGYWEQTGGLFGRSDRDQKLFRLIRFSKRLKNETRRVAEQRLLPDE